MTFKNNKTKISTLSVALLTIGLIVLSPLSTSNVTAQTTSLQIPNNALRTSTGYLTPLKTVDDKGNPLTLHVMEDSLPVADNKLYPCPPTYGSGVAQEGAQWSYPVNNANAIGLKTTWTMPTGTITNTASNGLYFNPVNFDYTGTTSGSTPYTFFQVDWGMGGSGGIQTGWSYALWYKNPDGTWHTPPLRNTMPAVSSSQGSTYVVQAALEPTPMASSDLYVVQVTKGTQGWIYSVALTYHPQVGQVSNFKSYQDEYILDHGSSTLSSNVVNTPTVVVDQSNSIGYDTMAITGATPKNGWGAFGGSTYAIMSPSISGKQVTDTVTCNPW